MMFITQYAGLWDVYMTDAYFDNNFDLHTSLEKALDVFNSCYANPNNSL